MKVNIQVVARQVGASLAQLPTQQAGSFLTSFIANVVAQFPEAKWDEIKQIAPLPCGEPECDCERIRIQVIGALDALRTDFAEQTAEYPR